MTNWFEILKSNNNKTPPVDSINSVKGDKKRDRQHEGHEGDGSFEKEFKIASDKNQDQDSSQEHKKTDDPDPMGKIMRL